MTAAVSGWSWPEAMSWSVFVISVCVMYVAYRMTGGGRDE